MTSNRLYSKLLKADLKSRIWAIALIGLGTFFLYPVVAAFEAGNIRDYVTREAGLQYYLSSMRQWLSFRNGMTVFGILMASMISGFSGFAYLNSKSRVDFYHSLPVRREKLFITNYINGILIVAIPYVISMVAAVCICIYNGLSGAELWPVMWTGVALNLIYFVLNYTVVVIAAMMTGNLIIGVFGSFVLAFYIPLAVSIVQGFFYLFFSTYDGNSSSFFENGNRLSPVMEYIYQMEQYNNGHSIWLAAAGSLAVSALLVAVALWLYRKRPSEAAGRAMAFDISRPVIRVLIVVLSGVGLGGMFYSIRESNGWALFGILCGAVISHCVIEIIYHFDFKKLFSHRGQLLGCILVCVGIFFLFRYDLTGYDTYLPKRAQIKDGAVEISELNNWTSYGATRYDEKRGIYIWDTEQWGDLSVLERMHCEKVEDILTLAAAGIEEVKDWKAGGKEERSYNSYGARWVTVRVCYHKTSGRDIYRKYTLSVDKLAALADDIISHEQYLTAVYPLYTRQADQVAAVRYKEAMHTECLRSLTAEQKEELLRTYQKEFSQMTIEKLQKEYPLGLIRFTTEADEAAITRLEAEAKKKQTQVYNSYDTYGVWSYQSADVADRDYYPLYPSFTETIRLLNAFQVKPGTYLSEYEINSIEISQYTTNELGNETSFRNLKITDPSEIRSLEPKLLLQGLSYYNELFQAEENLDIYLETSGEAINYDTSAYFPRGGVPELVKERLEKAPAK